jgi:hypothetical protein
LKLRIFFASGKVAQPSTRPQAVNVG